jgi:hypothetical protein
VPILVALALYGPILGLGPVADDFAHLTHVRTVPFHEGYLGIDSWIRPLETMANYLGAALLGPGDLTVVHSISLFCFCLCAALVHHLALALTRCRGVAFLAGLLFVCHPANMQAVGQMDTLSQLLAGLFSVLLLRWLLFASSRWAALVGTAGLALLAVFSKETAMGAVLAAPLVVALLRPEGAARRRILLHLVPCLFAVAVLLVLRDQMRGGLLPGTESGRYALAPGVPGLARNIVFLLTGTAYVGSTLDVFPTVRTGPLVVSLMGSAALLVLAVRGMSTGLREGERARKIVALGLFLLAGTFPVALARGASELYLFGLTPAFSILLALLVLEPSLPRQRWRLRPELVLVLVLPWMAGRVLDKVDAACRLDEKTRYYLKAMEEAGSRDGEVILPLHPHPVTGDGYSVLVLSDDAIVQKALAHVRAVGTTSRRLEIRPEKGKNRYLLVPLHTGSATLPRGGAR